MPLSNKEYLKLAKIVISKSAEFSCQEIDRELDKIANLQQDEIEFEEYYLCALWRKRIDLLIKINTLVEKTDDPDEQWALIQEVYCDHLDLPAKKLKSDIASRLEWLKKQTAHNFEKDIKKTINIHNITSPIEQLLLMEWRFGKIDEKLGVTLIPQKHIETHEGNYIIDFNITFLDSSDPFINVAIEIDGHEFHEKTKQQVAKDKKRDRALTKSGLTVLRFSGSEVFYSPRTCIMEIVDFIKKEKTKTT